MTADGDTHAVIACGTQFSERYRFISFHAERFYSMKVFASASFYCSIDHLALDGYKGSWFASLVAV
jgi:hypothetical protein